MPINITNGFKPGGMSVGGVGAEPALEPEPVGDGNAAASALMRYSGRYKRIA
jgi:hypothetical protein